MGPPLFSGGNTVPGREAICPSACFNGAAAFQRRK